MSQTHPVPEQFVQSLARGLAVIRAFDAEHPVLTLSEVAKRADFSRAAARRFLLTLADLGYVQSDGRAFSLTPRVLELGYSYLSGQRLPALAVPVLQRLSDTVHESASLAVLDGTGIVYLARVHTKRIMSIGITVGTRFPAYATGMGRVLLAELPGRELDALLDGMLAAGELVKLTPRTIVDPAALKAELAVVAERGYAAVDQELELGLCSIAVPLRDPDGVVIAALNVSMQAGLLTAEAAAERERSIVTELQRAADELTGIQRMMPAGVR